MDASVTSFCVTGLASKPDPPMNHWSSTVKPKASSREKQHNAAYGNSIRDPEPIIEATHLKTGIPVTEASRNAVYQTGSILYRNFKMSRSMLLYGSSIRYGPRLFVSMCACALKNGWNAPTWYHRTSMSRSGFPKKPPTSATKFRQKKLRWSLECSNQNGLTTAECHASNAISQDHLYTNGHMFPGAEIVTSPHCAKALRTGIEWTSQDEGSFRRVRAS